MPTAWRFHLIHSGLYPPPAGSAGRRAQSRPSQLTDRSGPPSSPSLPLAREHIPHLRSAPCASLVSRAAVRGPAVPRADRCRAVSSPCSVFGPSGGRAHHLPRHARPCHFRVGPGSWARNGRAPCAGCQAASPDSPSITCARTAGSDGKARPSPTVQRCRYRPAERPQGGYRAYSTARVSRTTVTLISPG